MRVLPIGELDTPQANFAVIRENLRAIKSWVYATDTAIVAEKLELLERALNIKEEADRRDFVLLVNRWHSIMRTRLDVREAIDTLVKQLDYIEKQVDHATKKAAEETAKGK